MIATRKRGNSLYFSGGAFPPVHVTYPWRRVSRAHTQGSYFLILLTVLILIVLSLETTGTL
jgi:hypothetical protein